MTRVRSLYYFAALLIVGTFSVSNGASIFGDDDDEPVPTNEKFEVKVLYSENTHTDSGYKFAFELSDGTGREEVGTIHNPGTDQEYLEVAGFYRYTGPDKYIYRVNYKSGPEGYQAMTSRYLSGNRISPVALKSLVG